MPVIPFIIILGIAGWEEFRKQSVFWSKHAQAEKWLWRWFWSLNIALVLLVSTAYSKRSRVETMRFLANQPDYVNMYVERSHSEGYIMMPKYYLGTWKNYYDVLAGSQDRLTQTFHNNIDPVLRLNYIIFVEEIDLDNRVAKAKKEFPQMQFVTEVEPSLLDRVLHFLNPVNRNESCYIYRI